MRKNLVINSSSGNDSISTTVTYVSTTATDVELYNFAVALNGLTNNTLVSVEVVTTEEITGE